MYNSVQTAEKHTKESVGVNWVQSHKFTDNRPL